MESSDDSFAWTNASKDTFDSDEMADDTYDRNQHNDESDSGKSYKKKLQKELFSNSDQHTESFNGQNVRKRKIKTEEIDNDNYECPNRKHMEIKPENDTESSKKKKNKHTETNGTHNLSISQDSLNYDESYLDLRVKEEEIFTTSKKKKIRKHSNASVHLDNTELAISDHTKQKKAKNNRKDKSVELSFIDTSLENDNSITQNIYEVNGIKVKKKKKKSKERLDVCDNADNKLSSEIILSDVDNLTENISDTKLNITSYNENDKRLSLKNNTSTSEDIYDDSKSQKDITSQHNDGQDSMSPSKHRQDRDEIYSQQISKLQMNTKNTLNNSLVLPNKTSQRKPKISDRIRFEDEGEEVDSEMETSQNQSNVKVKLSSKLKQFLKANTNLKPTLLQSKNNVSITEDDELWILRCPHELNIKCLQDTNLKLDGKCKIKIEGQTFEGVADEDTSRIAILTSESRESVIKNLPLKGIVDLHNKIPKVHFPEDNIIVNNQTNFIPLPETKCRHPLFGSHYKRAIKIPAVIAERLKKCCNESVQNISENRKKKKQKTIQMEISDVVSETVPELKPEIVAKKKMKKRKHIDNEDAPKKAKRVKYNPESAEAWESEKAIEENLFNF